jgi:hypothetical protein
MSRTTRRSALLVVLTIALLAVVALTAGVAQAATYGLRDTARLKVLSPTPGQTITGDLPIFVKTVGYTLNGDLAGTPNRNKLGHYHIILDGKLIDMAENRKDTVSMLGVTPGPHTLTLVPSNNDHSMVMAGSVDIPFTYAGTLRPAPAPATYADPPTINVTAPKNGAVVTGSSFKMKVAVTNFNLSGDLFGKDNIDGWGHWHAFVDNASMPFMKTMGGSRTATISLAGVTPGWHTFYAVIVNNQHMPDMTMPVMASVDVYVK